TVFEANLGAGIESEEVAGEIAEVAGTERTAEPVRHPECAREPRNLERGGQADDGEVRLGWVDAPVAWCVRLILGLSLRLGRRMRRGRSGRTGGQEYQRCCCQKLCHV